MLRYVGFVMPLLICISAQGQVSLSDQINAVSAAQENEKARQQVLQRAAAEQAARTAAQQRAAAITMEKQRIVAQAAIELQRAAVEKQRIVEQATVEREHAAAQKSVHEEARADKKREQDYEDQIRALQIDQLRLQLLEQQQKLTTDKERDQAYEDKLREVELQQKALQLKQAETRASRENDYIDRDLHRQDAQTDVVQSGADATQNLSQGASTFMQDLGTAAIKGQTTPSGGLPVSR